MRRSAERQEVSGSFTPPGTKLTRPAVEVTFDIQADYPDRRGREKSVMSCRRTLSLGKDFRGQCRSDISDKSMSFAARRGEWKDLLMVHECKTQADAGSGSRSRVMNVISCVLMVKASDFGEKGEFGDYADAKAFF